MGESVTSMYQRHFGLAEAPFSIAPDPRYLYMSQRHQEALATLLYGLGSDGGFVLLTGEVGAGKTTICRCLLEQMPDACDVAYVFNPKLTVTELLSTICDEFGIAYPEGARSIKRFVDLINKYLLESHARGRRAVLIIDEAQNLSAVVLEQIRLLTNLETNQRKLLQILLLGQPELVAMLARPELRQLAQRIVARYHLTPLDKTEVAAYVNHRLEVAGAPQPLFPDGLWKQLYQLSGGVPRVINVLCDRALLGAFVQDKPRVDRATLKQAAREVLPPGPLHAPRVRRGVLALAALGLAGATFTFLYQQQQAGNQLASEPALATFPGRAVGAPARAAPQKPLPAVPPARDNPAAAILTLPPDVRSGQSQELALATLLNKWHVVYHDREDPCTQATAHGLQCMTARGGLDELRQLNIPVILRMADGEGHTFYAALTELGADSATFTFGAQIRQVSLAAIGLQWGGDYTMLLRIPRETSEQVQRGEHEAAAAWAEQQLAKLQHRSVGTPVPGVSDDGLRSTLRQFQLSHGLTPDGVVGWKTLAHLSVAADPSVPRLAVTERRE